jgi:Cu/Ag efflux protein CusF
MPAMTMDYPVDDSTLLKHLSVADRIAAIVYVGDPTLHNVQVIEHAKPPSPGVNRRM